MTAIPRSPPLNLFVSLRTNIGGCVRLHHYQDGDNGGDGGGGDKTRANRIEWNRTELRAVDDQTYRLVYERIHVNER